MKYKITLEVSAILFMTLFLYTGVSKLMEYDVFKEQIAESPVLHAIAPVIAWVLPLSEFIVVLLLLLPSYRLKGLYAVLILMLLFTGYVIAILAFSKELPCSCGGILEELSWPEHLVLNGGLIILAIASILLERRLQAALPVKQTS